MLTNLGSLSFCLLRALATYWKVDAWGLFGSRLSPVWLLCRWSDHFLVDSLRAVVRVRPLEECVAACGGVLEELHFMESYFLERGPGLKYPTWDDYVAAHGLRLGRKVSVPATAEMLTCAYLKNGV